MFASHYIRAACHNLALYQLREDVMKINNDRKKSTTTNSCQVFMPTKHERQISPSVLKWIHQPKLKINSLQHSAFVQDLPWKSLIFGHP